MALLLVEKES